MLTEHFVFRRNTWARYDMAAWNRTRRLPWGLAATAAFALSFAVIIPSMSQAWYTGPIARAGTGDIGIVVGFVLAAGVYPVFRAVERGLARR